MRLETEQMYQLSLHRQGKHETGLWLAYYADRSGASVFTSELEALRHATQNSMRVKSIRPGLDIFDQVER